MNARKYRIFYMKNVTLLYSNSLQRCGNGTIAACMYMPDDGLQASYNDNGTTYVLTFITVVLAILLIIVSLFFVVIYVLR